MKHFLSQKKFLAAAVLLCLSGMPSVSMAEYTDTQVIEGNKKYTEEEIIINVKGKPDVAGFMAEDDEQDNVVTIGQNGKGTAHIVTESDGTGNSHAAGVIVGPETNLTINGNLNIKSVYGGSCFASGIAISNTGTGTGGKSSIVVNGDVTIGDPALQKALTDSSDDKNWGVNAKEMHGGYGPDGHVHDKYGGYNYTGARWAPTGVSATCNGYGSTIDLNGNVYIAMRGTALKTDPYYMAPNMSSYDLVTINANKGDVTIYTPYSTKESFYVAASYGGTININMKGMAGAGHKVDLTGNLIALKNYKKSGQPHYYQDGRINLALDNKASTWTGVVDNTGENQSGEINLWVQNGSTWTHLSPSKTNGLQSQNMPTPSNGQYGSYDGTSHVTNFHGGKEVGSAGNIIAKDKATIQIENYDGYTNVFYAHEGNGEAEENYKAGNIIIEKAKTGSGISLVTDSDGVAMTNEDSIAKVLNALAGKLIYKAYVTGEKNLTGSVTIAEGLTSSSKTMKMKDLSFKEANGQGYVKEKETPGGEDPKPPASLDVSEQIVDDALGAGNLYWRKNGYEIGADDHQYVLKSDTTIRVNVSGPKTLHYGGIQGRHTANITWGDPDYISDGYIDMSGHKLTLISEANHHTHSASGILSHGGDLEIKNVAGIDIDIHGDKNSQSGIYVWGQGKNRATLTIDNDDKEEHAVKIRNTAAEKDSAILVDGRNVQPGGGAKLVIKGLVDVENDDVSVIQANKGEAYIGGGKIIAKGNKASSLKVNNDGKLVINGELSDDNVLTAGAVKHNVQIEGNVLSEKGKLGLVLNTAKSYLKGLIGTDTNTSGNTYMILSGGASWHNEGKGARTDSIGESRIKNLEADGGHIFQKHANPIHVENYSGKTVVIYEHDTGVPTDVNKGLVIKGGDFKIGKAAAGSEIVLRTDNSGLNMGSEKAADKNLVNGTLNALANKLYYTAYKDGETNLKGKVEIAEGLTAQSASKRLEDMTFKKENGQGQYVFTPAEDKPEGQTITEFGRAITGGQEQLYIDSGVKQKDGTYKFTKDSTITIEDAVLGETYPVNTSGGDKVIVNAEGKTLTLHSKGKGLRVGIQSVIKNNKKIDITAGKLIVNAETQSGLSRAYGIWFAGTDSILDIHGNTEITTNGNDLSYGVLAGQEAKINLEGVKIRVNNAAKESGALKGTAKSIISVNVKDENTPGDKTVDIVGNVVTEKIIEDDGFGTTETTGPSTINLALTTGNSIWKGSSVYQDSVEDGYDEGETTTTTHGIFNLWLQNGAQWINEKQGKQTFKGYKGSHVSNLTGGNVSGVIIQKDANPIHVENYSGKTVVIYEHDTGVPTDVNKGLVIKGGDFKIGKAAAGSEIVLRTDNSGLNMGSEKAADKNLVNGTLNALANKLYYTAYKDGETNLKGKVEIAEGLTAQSASKRLEDMTFKKENGQGQYVFTPEEDKPPVSDEGPIKKTTTLTKDRTVTWSEASAENKYVSTLYTEKHTSKQEPMVVDLNGNNLTLNAESADNIAAAVYVGGNEYIDIKNANKDKKISITSTNSDTRGASGIYLYGNSHLTITGPVSIDKVETKGDSANGINSQGKDNEVLIEGPLTIKNVKGLRARAKGYSASGILLTGDRSKVTVTGPVDISGVEGSSLRTVGADTEISIGGGTITAAKDADHSKNYYAARVDKGTININMKNGKAGDTKTQITGDLYATGQHGKRVLEYSGGQLVDWAHAGVLNVALTDKDSFWTGAGVYDSYTSDHGEGGKTVHDIGKFNLHLKNGATWTNEKQSHGTTTTVKSAEWTGSILAALEGGDDAAHAGVIIQKESTPIHILDYKGHTTVIYAHDNSNPKNMIGGDTIITKAQTGSGITLRTDNSGLNMGSEKAADKNLVNETLNALANKLYYKAYVNGETNLKGKVEIAEGLTAQSVSKRLEDMTFKKENGQGQYLFTPAVDPNPDPDKPKPNPNPDKPKPNPDPDKPKPNPNPDKPKPNPDPDKPKPNPNPDKPKPPVIYGPKQTAMMRGAKSAMTTTMLSMRDNMTTMIQRLGDIHEGEEDGIWARTYGGKANYDKDQTKTKENFWGVQMGADKKQASGWHTGVSFDYQDGNAAYELGGKGDSKLYTLGIYGTKTKNNGEYIDIVAKAGRGQNDYTVYNDMGHKLKGDYKANAMGLSVEYGKRIEKGDKYLTPQIQLSYMKLQGTDYDAISDYAGGKKMHVKQDGMTSLVGRIGIATGKRTDKTDLYLKANLLHEFKGTTASTFSAENEPTGKVDQDFGDTWAELTLGMNHNIDKDKMVYADITKSFGGDYEMEWKANAGIRLRF